MVLHPKAAATNGGRHLLLYDGVCGLCSRLLQFVLERDRGGLFVFAALQSETGRAVIGRAGGNPDELTTMYVVANHQQPGAAVLVRSRAALFIAGQLGWPWRALSLLRFLPSSLLDPIYDIVARHRYRVFGQLDQCLLPSAEHRARFIE